MNKEKINRILNALEIIAYATLLFFYNNVNPTYDCSIKGKNLLAAWFLVALIRACVNHILEINLSNLAPILIVKKIFKK